MRICAYVRVYVCASVCLCVSIFVRMYVCVYVRVCDVHVSCIRHYGIVFALDELKQLNNAEYWCIYPVYFSKMHSFIVAITTGN